MKDGGGGKPLEKWELPHGELEVGIGGLKEGRERRERWGGRDSDSLWLHCLGTYMSKTYARKLEEKFMIKTSDLHTRLCFLIFYEGLFQTDSTGNSGFAGVQVQLE